MRSLDWVGAASDSSRGEATMSDPVSTSSEAPISWRTIVYGTPVRGSDDGRVGTVREVLGSDTEDIFHGLRVRLDGTQRDVMVTADNVATLATNGITLRVDRTVVARLPDFDEPATYHLSSVGWLRKHVGWKADSESDEGPG
jgi:hypothetical protein